MEKYGVVRGEEEEIKESGDKTLKDLIDRQDSFDKERARKKDRRGSPTPAKLPK